jgi:hypothetical protein
MTMKTLLVMVLASLAAVAQDDVEKWVKDLGSESFDVREKATAKLKEIGAPAAEALRKAAKESPDAEVRQRAEELLQAIAKPAPKPADKKRPVVPPGPGLRGASVQVQSVNGDTTWTISPAEGAPFTFRKTAGGAVQLDYTDGEGKEQTAKADSLEAFLKAQKDLAASFGITKEGIEFGGTKIDFDGNAGRMFRIMRAVPFKKEGDEDEEDEMDQLFRQFRIDVPAMKAAGASFEPVTEVLRSQLEIGEGQGLVVKSVGEDSAASRAGLKKHDVVLEIDGAKVAAAKSVKELLKKDSKVLVLRGGKRLLLNDTK